MIRPRWRGACAVVAVAALASMIPAAVAAADVEGSDVVAIGAAPDRGSLLDLGIRPNAPVLGIASAANGDGYWNVAGDGGVFSFGSAPFFGSMGGTALNGPMIGMAPTPGGGGYWMFAGDGGIFAFGDAPFFGSMGGTALNAPIVGMTPTASGKGYWMVAADGGVFAFGDAAFLGSTGSKPPEAPIIAMVTLPSGGGYWLVTSAGQVVAFGAAVSYGDLSDKKLSNPVVGISASPGGTGYWLVQQDGQVWAFGDASKALATGPRCATQKVVGLASRPQGDGLWLATAPIVKGPIAGLGPLAVLDVEDADIAQRIVVRQGCETLGKPASIAWADPLPGAHVSSAFGERIHPIYKVPQFHRGLDLSRGTSNSILASAAGTVLEVETRTGYGNDVVIDHGDKLSTLYGHMKTVSVKVGDKVAAGQRIGVVGSTGYATGPHLHFEIRVAGQVIDPTPFVRPAG